MTATHNIALCQDHWHALRTAVDDHGLGVLVSESGEHLAHRLVDQDIHGITIDNFDPLWDAFMAIVAQATTIVTELPDGGSWCPVCQCNAPDWIDQAATTALTTWKGLRP